MLGPELINQFTPHQFEPARKYKN